MLHTRQGMLLPAEWLSDNISYNSHCPGWVLCQDCSEWEAMSLHPTCLYRNITASTHDRNEYFSILKPLMN
jgi:hypothetical protein